MDAARAKDLLFADVAVALGAAEPQRLARAIEAFWAQPDARDLADALVREGVLDAVARDAVRREIERIIGEAGGDPAAAVARRGGVDHALHESFTPGAVAGVPSRAPLRTIPPGRYKDFSVIGKGGMGLVYLALDTEMNRRVAFKMVRPDPRAPKDAAAPRTPLHATPPSGAEESSRAYEELTVRFLQEAWVTGAMEHPGIVPVYELGRTEAGIPYYTMRYVRGERTLAAAIREAETLDARLALLEPFLKVCDAIAYAHARDIVHRDLKPENIALGEYGEAIVLDWGLAKTHGRPDVSGGAWRARVEELRTANDLRTVAGAMGTAGYISPEAALGRGDEVDQRSDVYSLGAILFEILTGRLPFKFKTFLEYVQHVLDTEPPDAHDVDEAIPEELSRACARALARKREDRFASAAEIAQAVRRWQTEGRVEQQASELLDLARAEVEAARRGTGNTILWHLDRASAACSKALHLRSESGEALAIAAEIKALRDHGIRERERASGRRTVVAAGFVVLVVASLVAILVARRFSESREEAEAQTATARADAAARAGEARIAQLDAATSRAQRANLYAALSSFYLLRNDAVAARLTAARALATAPSAAAWRALAEAEARWTPTLFRVLEAPGAGPLAFGPDGRLFVAAGAELRVIEGGPGGKGTAFAAGEPVRVLAISPDGGRVAVAGKVTRILDARDGSLVAVLPDPGRTNETEKGLAHDALLPTAIAFDDTGERLFVGHETGMILDWSIADRGLRGIRAAQDTAVTSLAWDGTYLFAGDAEGAVTRLDGARFDLADSRVFGTAPVTQILTSDDEVVHAATLEHRLGVAEFGPGGTEGSFRVLTEFEAPAGRARHLLVSPDRATVFSALPGGAVVAWDVEARRERVRILPEGAEVTGLALSPDGAFLAVAAADGALRVFALDMRWPPEGPESASAFATSANGARTVLARPDLTLEVWDNATGARIARAPTHAATAVAVAIDGDRVLLACLGGTVTVWWLEDRALRPTVSIKVPERCVTAVAFLGKGDEIVLGFLDGALEIWSASGRRPTARLDDGEGEPIRALRVAEGRIDAWDVARGHRAFDIETSGCVDRSPSDPPASALVGRAPPLQGPPFPWVARDPTWRLIDFENRYGRKLDGVEVVPVPLRDHDPLRPRVDPLSR
ncbi:MAG TPA: serine/threonine-protein kinase [Planctomycetota bacterium]|nr:serine/threonine-protein kinase [Planctomycetota bacterium]